MEIKNAKVLWMKDYLNDPDLKILIDKKPNFENVKYKKIGQLYLAEKDGFVQYFTSPQNGGGLSYGEIETFEGEKLNAYGCWSSRAGCINNRDFGVQVVDISYTEDKNTFKQDGVFISGSITLEKAKKAVKMLDDVKIERKVKRENEIYWIPKKSN